MTSAQPQQTARTDWFVHDRFGLFIHWGLYAAPARHEWVKSKEKTTDRGPGDADAPATRPAPAGGRPGHRTIFEGLGALLQGGGAQLYSPTQYWRGKYHVSMGESRC